MKIVKKRNLIIFSVLTIVVVLFAVVTLNKKLAVEVEAVDLGEVVKLVEETGSVNASNEYKVIATVSGIVKGIDATEGDVVKKGDVIGYIDPGTLQFDIDNLKVKLKSLDADFKEAVKPTDKNNIILAESTVTSTKVAYDQALKDHENNTALYEAGTLSKDMLDKSKTNLDILEANYEGAKAQLSIIKKGASKNVSDKFNSEIESLNIQLEKLMDMKEDYVVVSQYDGILTEKFISEGDYVMPGTALFEVSDNSGIYVQAEVLDSDAITLSEGNDVDIIFEDFTYKGKVKKIYPKAYNKVSDLGIVQKRIKIDIDILDDDTKLILGQEVDVDFIVKKLTDVLRVKKEYVYDSDTKHYVLLLTNGIIEEREVTLGLEGEDYYEIQSGLSALEQVVTNLSEDITIGAKAEIVDTEEK